MATNTSLFRDRACFACRFCGARIGDSSFFLWSRPNSRSVEGRMANRALRIISRDVFLQVCVRVMTSRANKACVLWIVAAAVVQAIRLETNITDTTEIRHHGHGVHAPMTGSAKLLR